MPEGDTVHRTATVLNKALQGETLLATDFRVPQYATWDFAGGVVTGTVARGKHLLTRIDHPERGAWTLHTHLKMEGTWRIHRPGQRWSRPGHQARVVLEAPRTVAVGFSLGVVELLPREQEESAVAHLGPDLLGPDWDEEEAYRRLLEQPDRPLGEALLDQTRLAGIGNVYVSEVCFLRGIHPRTPVGEVADLTALLRLAHRLLRANADRVSRVTTGNTRRGEQLWVYGRDRDSCRRCGTRVRMARYGEAGRERVTYWCPSCQPEAGQGLQ